LGCRILSRRKHDFWTLKGLAEAHINSSKTRRYMMQSFKNTIFSTSGGCGGFTHGSSLVRSFRPGPAIIASFLRTSHEQAETSSPGHTVFHVPAISMRQILAMGLRCLRSRPSAAISMRLRYCGSLTRAGCSPPFSFSRISTHYPPGRI
jgi:hypothetical protein